MATFVRAEDGGPLRTFSGGLAHECGLNPLLKAGCTLGWEGQAAHDFLILMENEPTVRSVRTENVRIEGILDGEPFHYTIDAEVILDDGSVVFVELKRGPDDLRDPRYARILAYCTEVCRRAGIPLAVVFREAVWASRHHRRNCNLFAASARTTIERRHLQALERAVDDDRHTYGSLAELLEPGRPAAGKAVVRALSVRGLVLVDLTRRLRDGTKAVVRSQRGSMPAGSPSRSGTAKCIGTPREAQYDEETTMRPLTSSRRTRS